MVGLNTKIGVGHVLAATFAVADDQEDGDGANVLVEAKAARLPEGTTMCCLRHTAITRAPLAGVPVRLVASSFDTSVATAEKTYSKFVADHGDARCSTAMRSETSSR
jgi:hypothetical protein